MSPDIDTVFHPLSIFFPDLYFFAHRAWLHSILGAIFLALVLLVLFNLSSIRKHVFKRLDSIFNEEDDNQEENPYELFVLLLTAIYFHLFLDYITTDGPALLIPFSKQQFALHLSSPVEPIVLLFSAVVVMLLILERKDKISVKKLEKSVMLFVIIFFLIMFFHGLTKFYAFQQINAAQSSYQIEDLRPTFNPFTWYAVRKADYESFLLNFNYYLTKIDLISGKLTQKALPYWQVIKSPPKTQVPSLSAYEAFLQTLRTKEVVRFSFAVEFPAANLSYDTQYDRWIITWYDVTSDLRFSASSTLNQFMSNLNNLILVVDGNGKVFVQKGSLYI